MEYLLKNNFIYVVGNFGNVFCKDLNDIYK